MSIPLPLGMPPSREEPRGLLDALLTRRYDNLDDNLDDALAAGPMIAPPIVPAHIAGERVTRDLVVELDPRADPPAPSGRRPVRYRIECAAEDLDDVLGVTLPAPLVVHPRVSDAELADVARLLTEAGHIPGLPAGHGPDAIADFLAVLAHADTGYVACAETADEVVALLAATVAALTGDAIRAVLAAPDPARLRRLSPDAAAAVREILLFVEVTDTDRVAEDLAALHLVSS